MCWPKPRKRSRKKDHIWNFKGRRKTPMGKNERVYWTYHFMKESSWVKLETYFGLTAAYLRGMALKWAKEAGLPYPPLEKNDPRCIFYSFQERSEIPESLEGKPSPFDVIPDWIEVAPGGETLDHFPFSNDY